MQHVKNILVALMVLGAACAHAGKDTTPNQEWLLIAQSMGYYASPALGDGGYSTEPLCIEAGQEVVTRMNAREMTKQKANTKDNVQAYAAKSWVFNCVPVRKR